MKTEWKNKIQLLPSLTLLLFFFLSGCAKEQSQEQEKREEVNRELSRLQKAEGLFAGNLEHEPQSFTPVALNIEAKRNPRSGEETPTLQVTLRVGLFGGVTIASDLAHFDYGQSLVTASFARPSGPPLELKAVLSEGELTEFRLSGPNSGTIRGKLHKVRYWPSLPSDLESPQFLVDLPVGGKEERSNVQGLLSLTRKTGDLKAPDHVDLPLLPNLEASLRIQGTAQVPQLATWVHYDPLKGTIEIGFKSSSKVKLESIFLRPNQRGEYHLGELSGQISERSFTRLGVRARLVPIERGRQFETEEGLPPTYFKGYFQGVAPHLKYRVLAELNYTGKEMTNSGELFFSTFPGMKLKIWSCMGEKTWGQAEYLLYALDHLSLKGTFQSNILGKDQNLEIHFDHGWKVLEARALGLSGSNHRSDLEVPTFYLEALASNEQKLNCQNYVAD